MEEFIKELQQNSNSNFQIKKDEYKNNISLTMDKLTESILETCKETMLDASKNGNYNAVIYQFSNEDSFDDHKVSFLVKGPKMNRRGEGQGLEFFENKGIKPIMQRIQEHLNPINCILKFDPRKKTHFVIARWKQTT
jgi:hypothetical protein